MQKKFYFLGGLPRSGSTLLGSILNQNPSVYVSPTSPLNDLYFRTEQNFRELNEQFTYDVDRVSTNFYKNMHHIFYEHINKPVIIDKHRGWTFNFLQVQKYIDPDPKIICTYRPLAEVIASFIKLADNDPDNIIDRELRDLGREINNENRAQHLWNHYVSDTYKYLRYGLENFARNILVVRYDDLIQDPAQEINRVYDFLGLERYDHVFHSIVNTCPEGKDAAFGYKGLHDIRPAIVRTSPDPVATLGRDRVAFFEKLDQELPLLT